jgi:hypothetical protein
MIVDNNIKGGSMGGSNIYEAINSAVIGMSKEEAVTAVSAALIKLIMLSDGTHMFFKNKFGEVNVDLDIPKTLH